MQHVLLIGATSAIASDVARLLAQRGARLVLLGRDADKLGRLVDELGDAVVGSRAMHFDDAEANEAALLDAVATLGRLDLALIAQGYLSDQLLSERAFDEARLSTEVNYLSAVSQLIVLANVLERQGAGHIAVISSVAGERGRPRNYTYGAAKAALTTYLQGLRSRLHPHVQVHTIKLGPVHTPMTVDHPKNPLFITSPQAAAAIVRAVERGRPEAYVPAYWAPIMAAVRVMPEGLFQRLSFLSGR